MTDYAFSKKLKVKVQVYSLISSLKTYHSTLHLTPWSLDLFIRVLFQLHGEHTVLQPFRRIEQLIVHIAISVLPGTHFHLRQVKNLRVKCLSQGHNILTMSQDWEGRNIIFFWKFCTKRDSKPHGRKRHRPRFNHCAMSLRTLARVAMGLLAHSQTLPSTYYLTYKIHCMLLSAHYVRVVTISYPVICRSQCVRDGAWRINRAPDWLASHVWNQLILLGPMREIIIIVSPLSMWLEYHTNRWDQLVYSRCFRTGPRAVGSFTHQCVVCMTVCIRTIESVSNLMNRSTNIIGPCVLIFIYIDHINLILHCHPL